MDRQGLEEASSKLGLSLTELQLDRFEAFEEHLYEANKVVNLTRVPREDCWVRHFLDSLLLNPFIAQNLEVLDIGSGPGFPSWPLANARPDLKVGAVDSNNKMLSFLETQATENLWMHYLRAEEWGVREVADVVTGRAVAPLAVQLEISAGLVRVGGFVIPMRTRNDNPRGIQLDPLGLKLEDIHEVPLPGTDIVRIFPIYRKVKETVSKYPRRWAEIKAKPLDKS